MGPYNEKWMRFYLFNSLFTCFWANYQTEAQTLPNSWVMIMEVMEQPVEDQTWGYTKAYRTHYAASNFLLLPAKVILKYMELK